MRILVIDDEREFDFPGNEVIYARNLGVAEAELFSHEWDQVWLDNDLGESREEVKHLVKHLEEDAFDGKFWPIKEFVVHTQNPIARQEMMGALKKWYEIKSVFNLKPWVR